MTKKCTKTGDGILCLYDCDACDKFRADCWRKPKVINRKRVQHD